MRRRDDEWELRGCKPGKWKHRKRRIENRRCSGWDMNLYRNREEGKIAGVCAGIADHFDFDPWVVRLIFIGAFFMLGGLAVLAYILGWVLMAPRRDDSVEAMEYDEYRHVYRRKNMFKHSPSPSERLRRAQERLNRALRRVEDIEAYVTSRQYELNKEFANMKKG